MLIQRSLEVSGNWLADFLLDVLNSLAHFAECGLHFLHFSKDLCEINFLVKQKVLLQQVRRIARWWKTITEIFFFFYKNSNTRTQKSSKQTNSLEVTYFLWFMKQVWCTDSVGNLTHRCDFFPFYCQNYISATNFITQRVGHLRNDF